MKKLVWLAPEIVPKRLNKVFEMWMQGYKIYPEGFVDDPFWSLQVGEKNDR